MTNDLARVLEFRPPKAHTHRDRYGKPIIQTGEMRADGKPRSTTCTTCDKPIPGLPYRRVTTYIDVLYDKFMLTRWKMRQVARGMAARDAFVVAVAAAGGDDRAVDRIVSDALDAAGSSDAATLGTALHKLAEEIDEGRVPLVPPSARRDLDAYVEATRDVLKVECETFVVDDARAVAGTFDRLVEVDGQRYIADIKTGSIEYELGKIAMQLAMYAGGKRYDIETGERSPLDVSQDYGLVIHLPAGEARCEFVWLDLALARKGLELVSGVWAWRETPGSAFAVPAPGLALLELIGIAGDRAAIEGLWEAHQHLWTDELTAAATARLAEIEGTP
jgi:hypothetical protein